MSLSLVDILEGELLIAVKKNNVNKVIRLVTCKSEVEKLFALVEAAKNGFIEIVKVLLETGIDINLERPFVQGSALQSAVREGHFEVVKVLLKAGTNVNSLPQNPKDLTPLMIGASEGYFDIVKILIEAGANVNEVGRCGESALFQAAIYGHENIFNYLLTLTDEKLIQKAKEEFLKGIRIKYIEENASPIINDLTYAIYEENEDLAKTILRNWNNSININGYNESGVSPLFCAVRQRSIDLIKLILELGADPNIGREEDGYNIASLMIVPEARWTKESLTILSLLLNAGADVNVRYSQDGYNALMYYINCPAYNEKERKISDKAVKMLLDHGSDVNVIDKKGNTVLSLAKATGNTKIIQLLKEAGATEN
jgi:uncharacterized protein